jgi:anti-sigma-K factor RskA
MPMDQDKPMVMGLEMPGAQRVLGAAMSIEPRGGSVTPTGPMVFRRLL